MTRLHGFAQRTGDNQPLGEFSQTGKFGRMFPQLHPFTPPNQSLKELGEAMNETNLDSPDGDNVDVPSGYTYLGQFIDHDITFDTTALQEVLVDPLAVRNFRTPRLDLDNLYGAGPRTQRYLYQVGGSRDLFLIGKTNSQPGLADPSIPTELPNDLPRASSGLAIIGDPRNDENLIVAQTHLAFLKFHNKVVAGIKDGSIEPISSEKSDFEKARELVIWHYQWIVLNDFLPRIIDPEQLRIVLEEGRRFYRFREEAFIPVEFSVAAYRLGHSMVRGVYNFNRVFNTEPGGIPATLELLFEFTAESGSQVPIPSDWIIDWRRFFEIDPKVPFDPSRKLDPFLADPLKNLPGIPEPKSLAVRNLFRGRSMGLPSGQSVARFMRIQPLPAEKIATGVDGEVARKHYFDRRTPLWYYILKEAQIQQQGKRLGQVGSRILAEVFVGLLEGDSSSFLVRDRSWKPTLGKVPGTFTMADLLNFAGDINPIGDKSN